MTKGSKRVDELEVGDIVITPGCKGTSTVSHIEKVGFREYRIICRGIRQAFFYYDNVEVTYLGNKKEEETMSEMNKVRHTQKVDCSALYPYFDSLANEELTFKDDNVPVYIYLEHQLKYIHELFEGVLGLTLEEVKTLYFERKMGKQESEIQDNPKTKKVGDLEIGDVIIFPDSNESQTVYSMRSHLNRGVIEIHFLEKEYVYNVGKDVSVIYLFSDRDAVFRRTRQLRTKKVKELCIGDKVSIPEVQKRYSGY